jgi:hypothetical protein
LQKFLNKIRKKLKKKIKLAIPAFLVLILKEKNSTLQVKIKKKEVF